MEIFIQFHSFTHSRLENSTYPRVLMDVINCVNWFLERSAECLYPCQAITSERLSLFLTLSVRRPCSLVFVHDGSQAAPKCRKIARPQRPCGALIAQLRTPKTAFGLRVGQNARKAFRSTVGASHRRTPPSKKSPSECFLEALTTPQRWLRGQMATSPPHLTPRQESQIL
jgi:hypothetical protein